MNQRTNHATYSELREEYRRIKGIYQRQGPSEDLAAEAESIHDEACEAGYADAADSAMKLADQIDNDLDDRHYRGGAFGPTPDRYAAC